MNIIKMAMICAIAFVFTACISSAPIKTLQFTAQDKAIMKIDHQDPDKVRKQQAIRFIGFNKDKSKVYLWDEEAHAVLVGCADGHGGYVAC